MHLCYSDIREFGGRWAKGYNLITPTQSLLFYSKADLLKCTVITMHFGSRTQSRYNNNEFAQQLYQYTFWNQTEKLWLYLSPLHMEIGGHRTAHSKELPAG